MKNTFSCLIIQNGISIDTSAGVCTINHCALRSLTSLNIQISVRLMNNIHHNLHLLPQLHIIYEMKLSCAHFKSIYYSISLFAVQAA